MKYLTYFVIALLACMVARALLFSHDEVMKRRQEAHHRFAEDNAVEIKLLIDELNSNMTDIHREVVETNIAPPFALHVILQGLDASYSMSYDVAQQRLTIEIAKGAPYFELKEVGWWIHHCGRYKYGTCYDVKHEIYEFTSRETFENKYSLSKFYSF